MDDATIASAQRGDREAQTRLIRELQDPWYAFCFSLLREPEPARDATQETALRFLRQLSQFRGDSQLRTWSLGIALNVVREIRRSRRPTLNLTDEVAGHEWTDSSMSPTASIEEAERRENLHATLDQLPARQREVVVLRYFEDLSTEQTASVMNCAEGTVKATLYQALRSLRDKLKMLVL